ncbi:MAG: RIP metalloprotease RseP [Pseudomonadota bacterium]
MSFLYYPLGFIVALGILIAVHEWGHFYVARRVGVRVLRFSIGFGPVLLRRFDKHGTEFCLSLIPLGGYVRLLDSRNEPVAEEDASFDFNRKTPAQKIAVLAAGAGVNLIFAVLIFWAVLLQGVTYLIPVVEQVKPLSLAEQAGLKPNDRLLKINDEAMLGWGDIAYQVIKLGGSTDPLNWTVERDGQPLQIRMQLNDLIIDNKVAEDPIKALGLTPKISPFESVIGQVVEGEVAERGGLKIGDRITQINETPIANWSDMVAEVQKLPNKSARFLIERENQQQEVLLKIGERDLDSGESVGYIGAAPEALDEKLESQWIGVESYGVFESLQQALKKTISLSGLILHSFGKMIVGQMSLDTLSGPITIAQVAGETAISGLQTFLNFLAYLSISLGVINLLPIPVLDGGHILMTMIEAIRRKPLSLRAQQIGMSLGIGLISTFMLLAIYNDLIRFFS